MGKGTRRVEDVSNFSPSTKHKASTRSRKPSADQRNRLAGAHFEAVFVSRAGINGLWAVKQQLTFKYIGGGKIRPLRSELDFALINRQGQVGYFDCKSFDGDRFPRSALNSSQVQRAAGYNSWNVCAGFVVWLRGSNQVAYFSGSQLALSPRGSSFCAQDGLLLGSVECFNLREVLDAELAR